MWPGTCSVVCARPSPGSLEDHIVGVVGVAHGIGPPQQHLEWDVGDELPEFLQTPPRALVQEAHCNIKRGSCTGTKRPRSAPSVMGTPHTLQLCGLRLWPPCQALLIFSVPHIPTWTPHPTPRLPFTDLRAAQAVSSLCPQFSAIMSVFPL